MPCCIQYEESMKSMAIDHEQLIQAMGDAVVVAGADGTIACWNPAAVRIFGFTEVEAMGRTLDLIIPEQHRAHHDKGFANALATGTTRYGVTLLRVPALHKDGRRLSIAFTVTLLRDEYGGISGIAAVIRDETERVEQDRQLRKRMAEMEAALRAAGSL